MALLHRLGERMADAGADPHEGRPLDPELHGDGIGDHEADATDVAGETVGALRNDLMASAPYVRNIRTARAVSTLWPYRIIVISRTTFCSAQASVSG